MAASRLAAVGAEAGSGKFAAVSLQDPSGTFPEDAIQYLTIPPDRIVTSPALYTVAIADLDADGRLDIVVSTNAILYFPQRSDAAGQFGAAAIIASQR